MSHGQTSPPDTLTFDEAMLGACEPDLQRQIAWEVQVLACNYAPARDRASFDAAANAIDEIVPSMTQGRHHARLWAAGFRRLARELA